MDVDSCQLVVIPCSTPVQAEAETITYTAFGRITTRSRVLEFKTSYIKSIVFTSQAVFKGINIHLLGTQLYVIVFHAY